MSDSDRSSFDAVEAALRRLGASAEPAELHGTLCGLVCMHGHQARSAWVAEVAAETGTEPVSMGVLEDLARATCDSLEQADMSFSPLLPEDDVDLDARVESLCGWCQGFMHGLGVAERQAAVSGDKVFGNDVVREVIRDFSEITRASFSDEETEAEGDAAYVALVEYVRVSVQLVFEELYPLRSDTAGIH